MEKRFKETHLVDEQGNPSSGLTLGDGFVIMWQPPLIEENRGAFVESIIAAAQARLEFFQSSSQHSHHNALAIKALKEALHWLNSRRLLAENVNNSN